MARFSALGDVAMTVPVVYSACRCYPDVQFTFLTRRSMTSIFLNPPENLRVVGLNLEQDFHGAGGLWQLFAELREKFAFDGFIDLHDVLRTNLLVRAIADLSYIVVPTEQDALNLENSMIKEYKPRYNVLLKDDKSYPWICITRETYPRVFLTRQRLREQHTPLHAAR